MVVLFTNIGLTHRTGTEIVTAALAKSLLARGHQTMVYSPLLGEVAREIAACGIPVDSNLSRLPLTPDVIHCHHHLQTVEALQAFPFTPGIFVCHDVNSWHDHVPRHPNLRRFVAVGLNARRRLVSDWPRVADRLEVIGNGVDTNIFLPRPILPASPCRALVYSNDAGEYSHWEPIAKACATLGIQLDRIGSAAGRQIVSPEKELGRYDLVFAKGRSAVEAACMGIAVILCDVQGLGEMLTPSNVEQLYAWNFGMRTLSRVPTAERVLDEIRRYDNRDVLHVRDFLRAKASLSTVVDRYLELYDSVVSEGVRGGFETRKRILFPQTKRIRLAAQRRIHLRIERCASEFIGGKWMSLEVAIENQSSTLLATAPPWPSFIYPRWIDLKGMRELRPELSRAHFERPIYPGRREIATIRILTPRKPGRYRLRLTMLQEGWRWLDRLYPRVLADQTIEIVDPATDALQI